MAALGVVAYARDRSENPGVATEIALLLAYLIGVLCASDRLLAAALAVMVTGLLALRAAARIFSNHWLQPGEVRSGLVLAALVLLVFPLVPNQPSCRVAEPAGGAAPGDRAAGDPVAGTRGAAADAGAPGRRVVGPGIGLRFQHGHHCQPGHGCAHGKAPARTQAAGAVLSCVATALHVLVVAATVQPHWLPYLALPALAGAGVAAVWGLWLLWGAADQSTAKAPLQADAPMFKLRDVVLITLLLTGIQVGAWHGWSAPRATPG